MSHRFVLRFIAAGSAQKGATNSEAIAHNDTLPHLSVLNVPQSTPTADALSGIVWIVGANPTADWTEQTTNVVGLGQSGWPFATSVTGCLPEWPRSARWPCTQLALAVRRKAGARVDDRGGGDMLVPAAQAILPHPDGMTTAAETGAVGCMGLIAG